MHDILTRYRALRKARLIGMLWVECDHCYLAPLDAFHGYNAREYITHADLDRLILSIEYYQSLRKAVQSEAAPARSICAA